MRTTHRKDSRRSFYDGFCTKNIRVLCLAASQHNIAFFGGAGVSTECGLPDYRSPGGIYHTARHYGRPPEEILCRDCFAEDPALFYRFYRDYFMAQANPGITHHTLAALERMGKHVSVITQNVDGLHRAAGSRHVFALHGNAAVLRCVRCGKQFSRQVLQNESSVPFCTCGGILKPQVILYGEQLSPAVIRGASKALEQASVLWVAGTSLRVYPAANLLSSFRGTHIVVVNREPTSIDGKASLLFRDPIADICSALLPLLQNVPEETYE